MRGSYQIRSSRQYKTSRDLLNPLVDDVHDIDDDEALDVMTLDRLNHLLEGIDDIEELRMRLDHLNHIYNQILRLLLHVSEDEAEGVVNFHLH